MNSRHCATCRWYTTMPNEASDHGVCEWLDAEQENNKVHETTTCEDWTARVDTPGVGCGVGEPQGRPLSDADRRTQAYSDWTQAQSQIRRAEAVATWRLLRLAHQAAADAAGVLEGLEKKGGES